MVRRTSIQRTFAETERGYQGLLPERVVYTRNLLRVYIAVVPVLQKSSPGQTHKMTHTITPPSHTMAHRKTHKTAHNGTQKRVSFRVPLCVTD